MQCLRCKHENRPGAKFCEECAAPLVRACASCGAGLSPTAKFCSECGHPDRPAAPPVPQRFGAPETSSPKHLAERIIYSKAALEGERKQITVLFADVKGSMELLADRDPEEARRILDPVLELMMEAVHYYEGTVNQVMGDGIMALFGAPFAHEDHAIRACYAALRMRQTLQRHADTAPRARGVPIQVRVGLNSGEVVVRSIGNDLRMDYTAVGQTTHLAARVEQMAAPNTIMATANCVRLAEGYVAVTPLGPRVVKGLVEPVALYEVTGKRAIRSRVEAALGRGLSRFVGRDMELKQIHEALHGAAQGHGQVVAIVGEPGAGKSRLIYEVVRSWKQPGWVFLETASAPYGRSTSYHAIVELLKSYFHVEEHDDNTQARDKIAASLRRFDEQPAAMQPSIMALLGIPVADSSWKSLSSAQRRRQNLEAVTGLLLSEARQQCVCLVVEDLHWIDSESQAVLDELVTRLPSARLLLMVSHRTEYHSRWVNRSYCTQLRLDPLPTASAAELLNDLIGGDETLLPFKRLLIDKTGGNPFFLEECVRAHVESGVLAGEPAAYRWVGPGQDLAVPPTVQAVIAARIDQLPPGEKALLETASVIGKDVAFDLLAAITGETEEDLRSGLARLGAAELLYETRLFPDLQYTFAHALTHEVAYGNLLYGQRRALHGQIVYALERLVPDRLEDHAERLAHHSRAGELWDRAVRYLRQAGARAFAHSAHRQAVACWEQALEAIQRLPQTPDTQAEAADLHLLLRNTLTLLGDHERTLSHLRAAQSLADQCGDQRRLGRALSFEVNCLFLMGRHHQAIESGALARAIAEELNDFPLKTVTHLYLGRAHLHLGDFARVINLLVGITASLTGELANQHLGLPVLPSVFARSLLVEALAEVGRFEEGARYADEALVLAETTNHPDTLYWACHGKGMHRLAQGDVPGALEALERAFEVCRTHDMPSHVPRITSELGLVRALGGRATESVPIVARAADEAAARKQAASYPKVLLRLGEVCLLAGQFSEAADAATRALELFRQQLERGHEAWALHLLAEIGTHTQPASAESLYREAQALATELGMRPLAARCDLGLGRLFQKASQRVPAAEALRCACANFQEIGMSAALAHAEAELKALT